jgi:DNA-binding PadR family transcriptional regulator
MTKREFLILRNLLASLKGADDMLLLEEHLREDVSMATPRLSVTEFTDALKDADEQGLVVSVDGVRGRKFKISDNGRAWLSENR